MSSKLNSDDGLSNIPLSSDSETDTEKSINTSNNFKTATNNMVDKNVSNQDDHIFDNETNADEEEEKQRLISQVLELQNTLDDLSQRVDAVKEENIKLKSENQVLGQYIENLMKASAVFQSTTQNAKKK